MELTYLLIAVLIIALPVVLTRLLSGRSGRPEKVLGAPRARPETPAPGRTDDPLRTEVASLLAQGGKLEAIKLVCERNRVPLSEAREVVERIGKEAAIVAPAPGLVETIQRAQQMSEEVRRLAARGQKVEAIKLLREKSGLGLKEAKDLVDRLG
jgi:ribosomal protein L7/L12